MKRMLCIVLCLCLLPLPVQGMSEEKLVALTFDDGPSGRFTRRLLDGLKAENANATFLLCGYRIEQYPELVDRILEEGHEIGLHGYSHDPMEKMTRGQITGELEITRSLLPENAQVRFVRTPGGAVTDSVRAVAETMGLSVLLWSVDPRDWATEDSHAIEAAVLDTVRDGDVILLHDMSDSSVDAALSLLKKLKNQGFRFVTVSELVRLRGIGLRPGEVYTQFGKNAR